jgi:hypothetical protein
MNIETISILVVMVVGFLGILFQNGNLGKRIDRLDERLSGEIKDLRTDVSALKIDVGVLKTDVSALKVDVSSLKTNVNGLMVDMGIVKTQMMLKSGSPLELTEQGEKLLDKVHGREIANDNKELLDKYIANKHFINENKFDILQNYRDALSYNFDKAFDGKTRQTMWKNGYTKEQVVDSVALFLSNEM